MACASIIAVEKMAIQMEHVLVSSPAGSSQKTPSSAWRRRSGPASGSPTRSPNFAGAEEIRWHDVAGALRFRAHAWSGEA
jgi:hypothetical protein